MEEQRRDKAEAHKARQRVLAQIQEDRHDRFGGGDAAVSPPKRATTVAPTASSSRDDALPNISTANPSEVSNFCLANFTKLAPRHPSTTPHQPLPLEGSGLAAG